MNQNELNGNNMSQIVAIDSKHNSSKFLRLKCCVKWHVKPSVTFFLQTLTLTSTKIAQLLFLKIDSKKWRWNHNLSVNFSGGTVIRFRHSKSCPHHSM